MLCYLQDHSADKQRINELIAEKALQESELRHAKELYSRSEQQKLNREEGKLCLVTCYYTYFLSKQGEINSVRWIQLC
jgi:hypothetical protein